jgi:hypothetical protein
MSAASTMFWSPGMQIHSLVPGRIAGVTMSRRGRPDV